MQRRVNCSGSQKIQCWVNRRIFAHFAKRIFGGVGVRYFQFPKLRGGRYFYYILYKMIVAVFLTLS